MRKNARSKLRVRTVRESVEFVKKVVHALAVNGGRLGVDGINENRLWVQFGQLPPVRHYLRRFLVRIGNDELVRQFEQQEVQVRPVWQGLVVL